MESQQAERCKALCFSEIGLRPLFPREGYGDGSGANLQLEYGKDVAAEVHHIPRDSVYINSKWTFKDGQGNDIVKIPTSGPIVITGFSNGAEASMMYLSQLTKSGGFAVRPADYLALLSPVNVISDWPAADKANNYADVTVDGSFDAKNAHVVEDWYAPVTYQQSLKQKANGDSSKFYEKDLKVSSSGKLPEGPINTTPQGTGTSHPNTTWIYHGQVLTDKSVSNEVYASIRGLSWHL